MSPAVVYGLREGKGRERPVINQQSVLSHESPPSHPRSKGDLYIFSKGSQDCV